MVFVLSFTCLSCFVWAHIDYDNKQNVGTGGSDCRRRYSGYSAVVVVVNIKIESWLYCTCTSIPLFNLSFLLLIVISYVLFASCYPFCNTFLLAMVVYVCCPWEEFLQRILVRYGGYPFILLPYVFKFVVFKENKKKSFWYWSTFIVNFI